MSFSDLLSQLTSQFGLSLTRQQLDLFSRYRDLLLDWNARINLTSITSDEGIAEKHFLDSLAALDLLDKSQALSLVDIGSGAGFPGLPLKFIYDHNELFLVESIKKKAEFLKYLIAAMNINKTAVSSERVEVLGQDQSRRGQFDIVLVRAVSALPVLVEYALPLLKIGSRAIFWKSQIPEEELAAGKKAVSLIGGVFETTKTYTLPASRENRQLIVVKKTKETPAKFPRRPGQPEKRSADRLIP